MRRLALLVVLALTACGSGEPVESAISEGYADRWPRIGQETLAGWASFPAGTDPRPLVLLGEQVSARSGFVDGVAKDAFAAGRVDADGKVPAEAVDAFAKFAKPGPAVPRLKVISAEKGTAAFTTDRGQRELPAWIFRVTGVQDPVAVLAVKPDYQQRATIYGAKVSSDGVTLVIRLPAAPVPCGGEARITYVPELLESPAAVAIGLKKQTGKVVQGNVGTCRKMPQTAAEYTVKLADPLGNRVLVAADGEALPVTSAQP